MNYLAHALLADLGPALRAGSTAGDFFKGPLGSALPAGFALGIRLHRAIDRYADEHPAFLASRARLPAEIRRWSGIIVDLFYDHVLARNWSHWHPEPLPLFSARVYADIALHLEHFDQRAQAACRLMAREDWLSSYATETGLGDILRRMAARTRRTNPLAGAERYLRADADGYADDCARFLTDAHRFVAEWLKSQANGSATPTAPDPAAPATD